MANELIVKNGLIVGGAVRATGAVTLSNYASGILKVDGSGLVSVDTSTYLTTAAAASGYQPLDGDLTAIAALAGTTGLVRKTAANTYSLDTTAYVDQAGSYANPSWITSLDWSKVSGTAPTTIAGYGITDAYTKTEIDNALTGLTWKGAVKAASTATLTLSGTQTVDGVALIAGDRVLVKNQSTASQNGIYVVAAGAWARATDADTAAELDKTTVFVERGTVNGNTQWTESATVTTIDSDTVTFSQISGAGTYTNGNGIALTGNSFSVQTQMSLTVDASGIKLVGDAASPGNTMYYGTNASGTKGFYSFVGLTDGDKGDITVSGSGATWTIDNTAITYAKIQNVTATNRLLGRYTGGAGSIEEIGLGTALSFVTGTLTLDADLVAIAGLAGTSGFLKKTAADTWSLDTSTYLTSYTETDTLDSVTTRGATTSNGITVGTATITNDLTVGTASAKVGSKTIALAVGTNVILSVAKATYKGMFVDYVLYNGTNQRSGTLQITNDGTTVIETETVTNDIGNTGSIDVDVVLGATMDLRVTGLPDTSYTIKIIYRYV